MCRIVGFTGTRFGMTDQQKEKVKELLIKLAPTKALHGMCVGADEEFDAICKELGIPTEGYPGKSASGTTQYRSKCKPDVIHKENTHFARNRIIVNSCDILIGCPYNDSKTGGTWYTINYALKNGKTVKKIWAILK